MVSLRTVLKDSIQPEKNIEFSQHKTPISNVCTGTDSAASHLPGQNDVDLSMSSNKLEADL